MTMSSQLILLMYMIAKILRENNKTSYFDADVTEINESSIMYYHLYIMQ